MHHFKASDLYSYILQKAYIMSQRDLRSPAGLCLRMSSFTLIMVGMFSVSLSVHPCPLPHKHTPITY